MARRALGVLLLAALVGVGGGLGAPLPAVSPSLPVDPPTTAPPYAADIDYPPLTSGLTFGRQLMGNSSQAWVVPVPRGWAAYTVPGDQQVPRRERAGYDELRFRPPDEPVEGGYSLRATTVNTHQTPAPMVTTKIALLRDVEDVRYLNKTEDSIRFTYRHDVGRLDLAQEPALVDEPLLDVVVVGPAVREHLDGHRRFELVVVAEPHRREAARTDPAAHGVATDPGG